MKSKTPILHDLYFSWPIEDIFIHSMGLQWWQTVGIQHVEIERTMQKEHKSSNKCLKATETLWSQVERWKLEQTQRKTKTQHSSCSLVKALITQGSRNILYCAWIIAKRGGSTDAHSVAVLENETQSRAWGDAVGATPFDFSTNLKTRSLVSNIPGWWWPFSSSSICKLCSVLGVKPPTCCSCGGSKSTTFKLLPRFLRPLFFLRSLQASKSGLRNLGRSLRLRVMMMMIATKSSSSRNSSFNYRHASHAATTEQAGEEIAGIVHQSPFLCRLTLWICFCIKQKRTSSAWALW